MSWDGAMSSLREDAHNTIVQPIRPNSTSVRAEHMVQDAVAVKTSEECVEQLGGFGEEEVEGGMSSSDEAETPEDEGEGREHDKPEGDEEAKQDPKHIPAQ